MNGTSKSCALILILLMSISSAGLWMVEPANAQSSSSFPTPSVPEFTVSFVNASYYTEPTATTTTDPYTGNQTVTTIPSRYVQDEYIGITIQNQSFNPFKTFENGYWYTCDLYFNIRTKGHFSTEWDYLNPDVGINTMENYTSQYTIVDTYYNRIPTAGQIDFQVQGIAGYVYHVVPVVVAQQWVLTGQEGYWSDIQTLNLPDGSVSVSASPNPSVTPTPLPIHFAPTPTSTPPPSPTSTPVVPELSAIVILPLFLASLAITLVLRRRRIA